MCGIIGYVGKRDAQPILLNGLKRLEYRGYDSAGVVTVDYGQLHLRRSVGKVSGLEACLSQDPAPGRIGIAHTRWATHGGPSEINAHPHLDACDRVAIVHNGIIENHRAIRQFLEKQGIIFRNGYGIARSADRIFLRTNR